MRTETVWLVVINTTSSPGPSRFKTWIGKITIPRISIKETKLHYLLNSDFDQAPIVQKVDNVIHRINPYAVDIAQLVSLMVDSAIHLFNNRGPGPFP